MTGSNFVTSEVRILDNNANLITSLNGGFPEWSLTGQYLAFLSPTVQVNRYNLSNGSTEALGGTTSLILPRINGTFWDPVWSPSTSNNEVAFVRSRETGRVDIYVMKTDGTNLRNLTSSVTNPINFLPVWSPDGQWIAFTSTDNAATTYKINVIRSNGVGSVVSLPTTNSYSLPFWAGDASRLAFWVVSDPANPTFAMVSFNTSTGAIGTVETFDPSVNATWGRVWIPGGGSYAYMSTFNATNKTFQLVYNVGTISIGTGWFPKWKPSLTPWSLTVSPNALIPPISYESDQECNLVNIDDSEPEEGIACALRTYRNFEASLTWSQLVALILEGEGGEFLQTISGCVDNNSPGFPAPLPTPYPTPGSVPVPVQFTPEPCNQDVHNDFIYTVVEQMFNKCDDPEDVPNNVGSCSEEGLLLFLGQVQEYRQGDVADYTTYQARASQEITYFLTATNGRIFGRCPCTTGNVRLETDAQQGQVRNTADPRYQGYAQTLYPLTWYSYSYFDNGVLGQIEENRYLKMY